MIYAITYADEHFEKIVKLNMFTAKVFGHANKCIRYSSKDIDEEFRKKNAGLLQCKRGAGYWIWKPYIILKTLERIKDGDFLMYMDAGALYVRSIKHLIKQLNDDRNDIFLSSIMLPNAHWCKRDAFVYMNCDYEEAANAHMVEPGYILLRKSNKSIEFVREWLKYACDPRIVSDQPNVCGLDDYPGFRENRHDQTVISLLSYKWSLIPYRGVSDSSELGVFRWEVQQHGFFGYSLEELEKLYAEECKTEGYIKAKYPRIVINTKYRDISWHRVFKLLYRDIKKAIRVDMGRKGDFQKFSQL